VLKTTDAKFASGLAETAGIYLYSQSQLETAAIHERSAEQDRLALAVQRTARQTTKLPSSFF